MLTTIGKGYVYIGAGAGDIFNYIVGSSNSNYLDSALDFGNKHDGQILTYDNGLQRMGGFAGELVSPGAYSKVVSFSAQSINEVSSITRYASTAARDWNYGVMERSMLNDLGTRSVFAEMTIPSFDELGYMAKNTLDFSTKPNGAVFWSDQNMKKAQLFGNLTGKTTLEQTEGGRYLDSLNLFSINGGKAAEVFDIASTRFAQGASGNVNAFAFGAERFGQYGERTWWRTEKPILMNTNSTFPNPNVKNVRELRFPWEPKQ